MCAARAASEAACTHSAAVKSAAAHTGAAAATPRVRSVERDRLCANDCDHKRPYEFE
jgi:hypothetical protein